MYPIPEPWRGHCSQYRPHAKPREQQHFFAVMGIMRGREHCPKTKCWVETPYTALYKIIWNIQYLFVTISINQIRTVSSGLNIRKCLLISSTYTGLVSAIRFKLFKIFSSHFNFRPVLWDCTALSLCGWYRICRTSGNLLLNTRVSQSTV
jgi:hypothetical protein